MTSRLSCFATIICSILLLSLPARSQTPISTQSLLSDMTDLSSLTRLPSPAYTTKQFSSYDRAAKSPTQDWFANNDCGQYLRVEDVANRKEYVMADTDGPGAIVRIWSANPAGTLRIYLDNAPTPVIEAKMSDLLGGHYPGLPRPIAGEYSKGWNLYFPIPYAKHCKITSDQGKFYYHVNYRTYPANTAVETFTAAQIPALKDQIAAVIQTMEAPADAPLAPGSQVRPFTLTIAPGQTADLPSLTGPAALTQLQIHYTPTTNRDEPALRSAVLEMTCDGEKTIESPLGDFFGTAPGLNAYSSLPMTVTKDGTLESRWVMPFKSSAKLTIRNLGAAPLTLRGQLATQPYAWTDASMHFHARWHAQLDYPTDPKTDWNYLTAQGKGIFAGVAFFIDNPVKDWWGEGDEKIYVDGETFPSHFGTGTEDYYGYAWCFPALFTHAYHNQTRCDGPGNFGRTSVNRLHILDRIPFTQSFKFDMEIWHWKKCNVNIAVLPYWYALPGSTDNIKPINPADLVIRPLPELQAFKVKGALEGESMNIAQAAGVVDPQEWDGDSNGKHLWWHAGQKVGDKLVLVFPVKDAGKYKVSARFLKAVDYGIAQIAINGQNAGDPIDFYNNGVIHTDALSLGQFDLSAGNNTITFTITGANPKAVKAYMIGFDYLLLTPIP